MSYKSIDEIEQFRFDDCQIQHISVTGQSIELEVEALIVRANNSQNTNYTESYAASTRICLAKGKIDNIIKDGYRYYDANDVLISEVPDSPLSQKEVEAFPASCAGAYLFEMKRTPDGYNLGIEFEDPEDHTVGASYQVFVTCDSVVCIWERYLNRVQS